MAVKIVTVVVYFLIFGFSNASPLVVLESINSSRIYKCVIPPKPSHGSFVVFGATILESGQAFDSVAFNLTCDPGYEVFGRRERFCVRGLWSEEVGTCVRFCKLPQDPTICYSCVTVINDVIVSTRQCRENEPDGTTVRPECRSPINFVLPPMRCVHGKWNYIPNCPKIDVGCNITVVLKDRFIVKKETVGELYISPLSNVDDTDSFNRDVQSQTVSITPIAAGLVPFITQSASSSSTGSLSPSVLAPKLTSSPLVTLVTQFTSSPLTLASGVSSSPSEISSSPLITSAVQGSSSPIVTGVSELSSPVILTSIPYRNLSQLEESLTIEEYSEEDSYITEEEWR